MLDMQRIRDNPQAVAAAALAKKQAIEIDSIIDLDVRRRAIIKDVDLLKSDRNRNSENVARLKKDKQDASELIAATKKISENIKAQDEQLAVIETSLNDMLIRIPNIPHASVPLGTSEKDNRVVSEWGSAPEFDFTPKDHMQIGTALDLFDFPRGAKISGAGFPVYKRHGALLERAMLNFMLDLHVQRHGYTEIFPPFLVNRESLFGTGQIPKSEEQMYRIPEDGLYCIPTAEVPVTNLHRDEILEESMLPIRYCAYSACFRREAGAYGKDTKGFLRVHEFNKVELVKFVTPQNSYDELETLRNDAEAVLQALGLRYRVLELCNADLSFAAAKCYDLELWAPGEGKWLEVSSCSNFEDFQARRMNIRYRPANNEKPRFVHTLNGSGVATARLLVAILENYQNSNGTVRIPPVLQPYMHGLSEIMAQ